MSETTEHERFLRLYTRHQRTVFSFLLGAVGSFSDAEDVHQEITLVLWRKFDRYDPKRPFVAWALGMAKLEAAKHLRKKRQRTPLLPPEVLEALATTWSEDELVLREARDRLSGCVKKLPPKERKLLAQRYREGLSQKEIARRWRKSIGVINTRLVRIRRNLLMCTQVAPNA
jgi:RNA polymerase sigma-70 factor (ECF subfamily)